LTKRRIELSCPACGSNRLHFPKFDNEQVTCDDCRCVVGTLEDAKAIMGGQLDNWPTRDESASERAATRRLRHAAEIEASHAELRNSIAETDRLVIKSNEMLRWHHKECDDDVP
jgi:transcription initiation factor TFIIIB Brf1 subunit/transcription initiation factor TFIIB